MPSGSHSDETSMKLLILATFALLVPRVVSADTYYDYQAVHALQAMNEKLEKCNAGIQKLQEDFDEFKHDYQMDQKTQIWKEKAERLKKGADKTP